MKKNNKKGFTLIELLAVLVVLAILALIAIPIVIKVINNAREDSYKRSIEGYARAAELAVAQWGLQHPGEAFPTNLEGEKIEQTYTIDYKGDKVVCQKMDVEENTGLIILRYCQVMKNDTEAKSKKYYKYEDSNVTEDMEPPIVTYEEYNVGDAFTFEGSGYHVISTSDTSQDYVVALKDEPLTVGEVNIYGTGHINQYTNVSQGTVYNYNGYGAIAYYTSSTCGYINDSYVGSGCTTEYDSSEVKYVVDAWSNQYASKLSETNGYKARLITYQEIIDNIAEDKVNSTPTGDYTYKRMKYDWAYNNEYWYWTMTPYQDSASRVWNVNRDGKVDDINVDGGSGTGAVRPVINVLKSEISKN